MTLTNNRAYSPQSPSALSNGTTIIEAQVETAVDMVAALEAQNAKSIDALPEAASAWKQGIADVENMTLLPQTSSWWNAANVPGKKVEGMT